MTVTLLRGMTCAAVLLMALPVRAPVAEKPVELAWEQLIPQGDQDAAPKSSAWGMVQHGQFDPAPDAAEDGTAVVTAYDGKRVRIPGFMVPLEFEGESVKTFLLVPYFGACIHVPPPPPNQIVYIESGKPIEVGGLFEPVSVTGTLAAAARSTELAEVGYRIVADAVTPVAAEQPRSAFERYLSR